MGLNDVPNELLIRILTLIRKPTPTVLSRPDRAELKQHDLTSAIRVSKLFRDICTPLLYTVITTDDFPSLFLGIAQKSNRSRFATTQRLNLEYSAKGEDSMYVDLLSGRRSLWQRCGHGTAVLEAIIHGESEYECRYLIPGLQAACALGMSELLPRLHTMCISSIYGDSNYMHRQYSTDDELNDKRNLFHARSLLASFIPSGSLRHLCIRGTGGPLAMPPFLSISDFPHGANLAYTRTIHFTTAPNLLPIVHDLPTTWICEADPTDDWAWISSLVAYAVGHGVKLGKEKFTSLSDHKGGGGVDLDVYCSTDYFRAIARIPRLRIRQFSNTYSASSPREVD